MDYQPRIADAVLARGLKSSGAVLIEGVKASGKTETATRIARSAARFDTDPDVAIKMDIDPHLLRSAPRDAWPVVNERNCFLARHFVR